MRLQLCIAMSPLFGIRNGQLIPNILRGPAEDQNRIYLTSSSIRFFLLHENAEIMKSYAHYGFKTFQPVRLAFTVFCPSQTLSIQQQPHINAVF